MEPEWILTTDDNPEYRSVSFKEMFQVKDRITSLTLLWTYNSYRVDVVNRHFIVNGGRRLAPQGWDNVSDVRIEYAKRHAKTVTLNNGDEGSESISVLVGLTGKIQAEEKTLLLHISGDGQIWTWTDHR